MTTRTAEVFVNLYDTLGVMAVASVEYEVYGGYAPATRHSPEEYPELEATKVTSVEIDECLCDEDPDEAELRKAVEAVVFDGGVDEQLWDAAEAEGRAAQEAAEEARYDELEERRYYAD